MKKFLTMLLVISLLLTTIGVVACGTSGETTDDNGTTDDSKDATTTTTARQAYTDPGDDDDDDDDDDMPKTEFNVGTIEELVDAMEKISYWEVALDSNITLTADLDFTDSEYSTDNNTWFAMEEFRGVLDGAGHKITGLKYERYVENGDLIIDDTSEYIVRASLENGCAGYAAFGIFARMLNGGTIKNLTLENCSVFMNFNYNRNFRVDAGGLVGFANNATFENISFVNTDMTTSVALNINQGNIGGMGLLAGRVFGTTAITNCAADAECEVDATNCGRLEAGGFIGIYVGDIASVSTEGSTTAAYVTVMDPEAEWTVPAGNSYSPASYRATGVAGAFANGMIGLVIEDDSLVDQDAIFNYS